MNCNQSYHHIIFDIPTGESDGHLAQCGKCSAINQSVGETMAVLEMNPAIPDGLTEKVIKQLSQVSIARKKNFDFSNYLQLAAVIVVAMVLGVVLGRNANSKTFISKQQKKNEALIEFREMHHLNVDHSAYNF